MLSSPAAASPGPPPLPAPAALGLPAKFREWRPHQAEAVLDAGSCDTRFCVITAPTGSGKTGIYMALRGLLDGPRTAILTSTKALQQQLRAEFGGAGLADVRGANAYPCRALMATGEYSRFRDGSRWAGPAHAPVRWQGCDEGPCHHGMDCTLRRDGCDYYDAVRKALKAPVVSTNYSYWLHRHAHVPDPGLGAFDLLVCDEAHTADAQLANFLTARLASDEIDLAGSPPPDDPNQARRWGDRAREHIGRLIERIETEGLTSGPAIRHMSKLKNLRLKIDRLSAFDPRTWVWTREGRRVRYGPVMLEDVAEKHLYLGIPRVVLLSATATRRTALAVGAPDDDLTSCEYPSPFAVQNRTVSVVGSVRMRHRMSAGELGVWMSRIDHIIGRRPDRKGIIHTTSYERMSWIAQNSEHRDTMLTHTAFDLRRAINRFRRIPPPAVLVSPSVTTGYDFPDDECRYVIIGKVPFPSVTDKFVAARKQLEPDYPAYMAMQTLVQSAGRAVRSARDWCEIMIVDAQARWFLRKYAHLAPQWFLDAVRYPVAPPEPPRIADV